MDLVYLALIAGLALATVGYLWLCERVGDRKWTSSMRLPRSPPWRWACTCSLPCSSRSGSN